VICGGSPPYHVKRGCLDGLPERLGTSNVIVYVPKHSRISYSFSSGSREGSKARLFFTIERHAVGGCAADRHQRPGAAVYPFETMWST